MITRCDGNWLRLLCAAWAIGGGYGGVECDDSRVKSGQQDDRRRSCGCRSPATFTTPTRRRMQ
jgi:hypothetical protein